MAWDKALLDKEWVEDCDLVGADRLIKLFFMDKRGYKAMRAANLEEESSELRPNTRNNKKEQKPKESTWNLSGQGVKIKSMLGEDQKPRLKNHQVKTRKFSTPQIDILIEKRKELKKYIKSNRNPGIKLDYLCNFVFSVVDFVEWVFLKDDKPFCSVRTLPPVQSFIVSIKDMEIYFPITLREHFKNVLDLQNRLDG